MCRYIVVPTRGLTKVGASVVTLVVAAAVISVVAGLVVLKRKRKARLQEEARRKSALIQPAQSPEDPEAVAESSHMHSI